MSTTMEVDLKHFFTLVREKKLFSRHFEYYATLLFEDISFKNATMLDIGAGVGLFSFYAACMGAKKVLALEPEIEGHRAGSATTFREINHALGLERRVELCSSSLQGLNSERKRFDIILLHNSINHLNEKACTVLHKDLRAVAIYLELFRKLHQLASPKGQLIVTANSRHNLFGHLGITNPFVPTIEWHKHQPPHLWARLLKRAGFRDPRITWLPFNRLRTLGKTFLSNPLAAYMFNSYFCFKMRS